MTFRRHYPFHRPPSPSTFFLRPKPYHFPSSSTLLNLLPPSSALLCSLTLPYLTFPSLCNLDPPPHTLTFPPPPSSALLRPDRIMTEYYVEKEFCNVLKFSENALLTLNGLKNWSWIYQKCIFAKKRIAWWERDREWEARRKYIFKNC